MNPFALPTPFEYMVMYAQQFVYIGIGVSIIMLLNAMRNYINAKSAREEKQQNIRRRQVGAKSRTTKSASKS